MSQRKWQNVTQYMKLYTERWKIKNRVSKTMKKWIPATLNVLCRQIQWAQTAVDMFLCCSNTDKTCADQRQLHQHPEFCGGQNDMAVGSRWSQCVDAGYTAIVPSRVEVQNGIQAVYDQIRCLDIDSLLCKQYKQLIMIKWLTDYTVKFAGKLARTHWI